MSGNTVDICVEQLMMNIIIEYHLLASFLMIDVQTEGVLACSIVRVVALSRVPLLDALAFLIPPWLATLPAYVLTLSVCRRIHRACRCRCHACTWCCHVWDEGSTGA
jgi:hypothetical protein